MTFVVVMLVAANIGTYLEIRRLRDRITKCIACTRDVVLAFQRHAHGHPGEEA